MKQAYLVDVVYVCIPLCLFQLTPGPSMNERLAYAVGVIYLGRKFCVMYLLHGKFAKLIRLLYYGIFVPALFTNGCHYLRGCSILMCWCEEQNFHMNMTIKAVWATEGQSS